MKNYIVQTNPLVVPTTDGKLIEEHFGFASINSGDFSFAHMIAPPFWSEPFQVCEFDEVTYVISGKKSFQFEDEEIILTKGESIIVKKGTKIKYSNPFNEACEYVSVCIPAFKLDRVERE